MNKGRRNELTKLIYEKRCRELDLSPLEAYSYKQQGKPCSCYLCTGYNKPESRERKKKHKGKFKEDYNEY